MEVKLARSCQPTMGRSALPILSLAAAVLQCCLVAVPTKEGHELGPGARRDRNGSDDETGSEDSASLLGLGEMFRAMEDLIEEFTRAMDMEKDGVLFESTTRRFSTLLSDFVGLYPHRNDAHDLAEATTTMGGANDIRLETLLRKAVFGAFQLRMNSIKDWLSTDKGLTVEPGYRDSIANWSLTLVKDILHHANSASVSIDVQGSVEVAVKLQLSEAVALLLFHSEGSSEESGRTLCSRAMHYAVTNQDTSTVSTLINVLSRLGENRASASDKSTTLCTCLTHSGEVVSLSPWGVASVHCSLGLSCKMAQHLWRLAGSKCQLKLVGESLRRPSGDPLPRRIHRVLCLSSRARCRGDRRLPGDCRAVGSGRNYEHKWLPDYFSRGTSDARISGWATYAGIHLGNGVCDIPRVRISALSAEDFESIFVSLSVPVLLEGGMEGWQLFLEWKRSTLLRKYAELDVLVGSIPYGEVFGELHGVASIAEFLAYMDHYSRDTSLSYLHGGMGEGDFSEFKAPLYVFDSEVLKRNFAGFYSLPEIFSLWTTANVTQYHQMILGPAGSGSPLHYHCPAVNALVYGRKKWLLYPPASAVYSKQHPLLWFAQHYSSAPQPLECVQHGGEMLFVPSGWSHAVVNLDESIGLAVEFDTRDC